MGLHRLGNGAFVPCRQHRLVFPSSTAAIHISPPSLQTTGALPTCLFSLPNDEVHESGIKRKRGYRLRDSSKRTSKLAFLTLLCTVSLLCGAPNLDGSTIPPFFDNRALALEEQNDPTQSSSSWTSSTAALSDQLFKSLSERENAKTAMSSIPKNKLRYWDSISMGSADEVTSANERLVDGAVATISSMYYDSSGGFNFDSQEFYATWKKFRYSVLHPREGNKEKKDTNNEFNILVEGNGLDSRENVVKTLKSVVSSLNDPYSKYLTREELWNELHTVNDGFLGTGALVDVSASPTSPPTNKPIRQLSSRTKDFERAASRPIQGGVPLDNTVQFALPVSSGTGKSNSILSVAQAANLPVVTAIAPDSPAERAGLVVGDRIASVGDYQFTSLSRSQVEKALKQKFHAENYFGRADLTIAKQVVASSTGSDSEKYIFKDGWYQPKRGVFDIPEQLLGYKLSHVKSIPTTQTAKLDGSPNTASPNTQQMQFPNVVGGNSIVHYELLTPNDSIFQHMANLEENRLVGYIRLTRFSKASTAGYVEATKALEEAGAQSYIIDLRNNYGGVIQEAMVTASSLLRDPHSVLCYTLNSRGGFKPQENQEYVVDTKYPGYLLSSEPSTVSRDQVRREHPEYLEDGGWTSPTSYASLRELRMTRGIKPAHAATLSSFGEGIEHPASFLDKKDINVEKLGDAVTKGSQKKLVILINEGTASAAEVFASSLHDNGRALLVGSKTFGKGLIQHTFPLPDGGGLRLTVAEYLTPSLHHVTKIGGARYDNGVKPDVRCESKQGIPQNVGADICVGVALDVLESKGG